MAKKKRKVRRKRATRRKKAAGTAGTARRGGRRPSLSTLSLATLKAEIERRTAVLHERRDALQAELSEILSEIGGVISGAVKRHRTGRAAGAAPGARRGPRAGGRRGGRGGNVMSLVEALQKTLSGRTMGVSEAADAVQKAGYRTKSPNFRTIVNQALISNKKLFKRVGRGQYTAT
jgi:hypothetical protein